jgi:hypothetical protein
MGSSLSPPGPNAVHLWVDMQNLSRLGDRGRRRGWKRRYPPSRGLPHIPPNVKNRHVAVDGNEVRFRFTGKSGKQWSLRVRDRRVAKIIGFPHLGRNGPRGDGAQ